MDIVHSDSATLCRECSYYDPVFGICTSTCHHVEGDWECENIQGWCRPIDRTRDITYFIDKYPGYCECVKCGVLVKRDIEQIMKYNYCPQCGVFHDKTQSSFFEEWHEMCCPSNSGSKVITEEESVVEV